MKIMFVSLGCDKNLVDSEMMITSLRKYRKYAWYFKKQRI